MKSHVEKGDEITCPRPLNPEEVKGGLAPDLPKVVSKEFQVATNTMTEGTRM
jgi:hypothetical protein